MATKTDKLNWFYYRQSEGCDNRFICQYMRLDYLIQLLETGKYYVKRRNTFEDANESCPNLKLALASIPIKENGIPQQISFQRIIPPNKTTDCPTSCWSKAKEEKYLMWKCYATEIGACVRTTVHDLIASLQIELDPNSEDRIVCGSIDYKYISPSSFEEYLLFDKDKSYADEEEFRFYFHCPSYDTDKNAKGIFVPVDTKVMIDEIILSPFISLDAADKLIRMIKCAYGIEVKRSKIKIK